MKRIFISVISFLLFCGAATLASPFYDFKIVAQTGSVGGFPADSFKSTVSINDSGMVAFIAKSASRGEAVFVAEPSGDTYVPRSLEQASQGDYGSVCINNSNQVAVSYSVALLGATSARVRRYSLTGPGTQYLGEDIVEATTARRIVIWDPCVPFANCPITIRLRIGDRPFDDTLAPVNINDDGMVALTGLVIDDSGWHSYHLTRQGQHVQTNDPSKVMPYLSFTFEPSFQPVIGRSGELLARFGNYDNAPILLYDAELNSGEPIAVAANFTRLGQAPGMSDDTSVVAFYGEIDRDTAKHFTGQNGGVVPLPVTPGRGILASVKVNGVRHIVRVAGEVFDPNLHPGERLVDGIGLGQDYNFDGRYTSASFDWQIVSFIPDARVAVSNPKPFADVTKGSYVTVVYMANNSFNGVVVRKAIFSSRINLFTNPSVNGGDRVGVEAPVLVAQVGDTPKGFGPITDLGINDSVKSGGQIAFWAKAASAESVVLASPFAYADVIRWQDRFDPDSPIVEYVVPAKWGDIRSCTNSSGVLQASFHTTYEAREAGEAIDQIILHATAGVEASDIKTLGEPACDPVSVHYLISREGRVTQIVQEEYKAYHAGVANSSTVGIELTDNKCHENESWWTVIQLEKAALLARDIAARNRLRLRHLAPNPALLWPFGDRPTQPFIEPPWVAGPFEETGAYVSGPVGPPYRDGFATTAGGIISHGQVRDRSKGKHDPYIFPWPAFMTMVNHGIGLTLNSPANLFVTDSQGRRTGYDAASGQTFLEIPGSQFTGPGTEPQSLSIPDATNSNYTIQVIGTSNGVFHLDILASGMDAGLMQTQVADTTAPGVVTSYTLNHDSVSGAATTVFGAGNLPPVAYDDFATTVSNTPVAIAVLANDNDPEGFLSTNSVVVVTNPASGTVTVNATNSVATYTPPTGFIGTNTFAYTVRDSQGAVSAPAIVTIIVAEPVVTNPPPIAVNDSATTTNGIPVTINVLANDISTNGVLDPTTVIITRAPTNGTASVDAYTGAITYTPNAGFAGTNTLLYTVQDDLGSTCAPGTVTVTVAAAPKDFNPTLPPYIFSYPPITSGSTDHRYPRINNRGDIVWQERVGTNWQVYRRMAGQPGFPVTFTDSTYVDGLSPAIADDGSVICYRSGTGNSSLPRNILIYPNQAVALTNSNPTTVCSSWDHSNAYKTETFDCQPDPSLASDGKPIWTSQYNLSLYLTGGGSRSSTLYLGGQTMESVESAQWDHPDANADGAIVFGRNGQVFRNNQPFANGQFAHVNDAPSDTPDIVYANGNRLYSTIFGELVQGTPNQLAGTWVDINKRGVLVIERQVGGYYQVFKAFPWEVRIVSRGGTNGIVGLPYRYDSDNAAEAYGAPENSSDDPRGFLDLEWSLLSGPPGFTIEEDTGQIHWVPAAPGNYTAVIRVWTGNPLFGIETEDTQTLHIRVIQSTMEVVDAVDFRMFGTPDLPTVATNYASGGAPRIGVLADGASRLLLRMRLLGADANSFPALNFAIAGTNAAHDGLLRSITGSAWSDDAPAAIATFGATNFALCLYEAPQDFDAASQPVRVHMLNGTNIITTQSLLLRRPPVVLVNDGWSGPEVWPLLISQLLDAGFDVYPVDYAFTSASTLNANESRIFLKNFEALGAAQQAGFAASSVDLVGHGTGGILGRLHAQRYAAQDYNYRKGDVHKLITVGTPHAGSWLAGVLTQLRSTSPSAWTNLRSAVLAASEAGGRYPAVDLDAGLTTNAAPGSLALAELETLPVPSHAVATSTDTLPPGDLCGFIQFCLGLTNGEAGSLPAPNDGYVTLDSARGGIATNAFSLLPTDWFPGQGMNGIPHFLQPYDTRITSLIVDLLKEPVATLNHFASFPAYATLTNPASPVVLSTNLGTWLVLAGATNGQTFTPGQTVTLTATATGGRALAAVQFLTPNGAVFDTTAPFELSFQVPAMAVGKVRLTATARDATGGTAWATVALDVLPGATLQSLQVEPSPVVLITKDDFPLRVWGLYDDGSRRDVTSGSSGTKYGSSDRLKIAPTTSGVLHIFDPNLTAPLTISVTNGAVWTNVQVAVAFSNLPPVAYIATTDNAFGPAPLDVHFNSYGSRGGSGSLSFHWDFGDGTTSDKQVPDSHRFVVPGQHAVTLVVTDTLGLAGTARYTITVEPRLVMLVPSLVLTQRIAYSAVIVTNGGQLQAANGLDAGDLLLGPGSLSLGQASTSTSTLIQSNGVLTTVAGAPLDLTVGGQLGLAVGGLIDARGKGYEHKQGPGAGWNGYPLAVGGSYGGLGNGAVATIAYGSFLNPLDLGSGGGDSIYVPYPSNPVAGGSGGGAIRLQAQRLQVDGTITADGLAGSDCYNCGTPGGGSGGSIQIGTDLLAGSGAIRANGGGGLGSTFTGFSSGGGGRVALFYGDKSGFGGTVTAFGGDGAGAGTVYWKKNTEALGELVIDNGGKNSGGWSTPLQELAPASLRRLTVGGSAHVDAIAVLTISELAASAGANELRVASETSLGDLNLSASNSLTIDGEPSLHNVTVSNATLAFAGSASAASVAVRTDGVLTTVTGMPLDLAVSGELLVAAGGLIDARGKGYEPKQGPGAGWDGYPRAVGGSYGGLGNGAVATNVYGSFLNPLELGSGGGDSIYSSSPYNPVAGGAGGGAIRLQAQRLQVDGTIAADGLIGSYCFNCGASRSGSGGSIQIAAQMLTGRGAISANGGAGSFSAYSFSSGGGGRVALFYGDKSGFGGTVTAFGGDNAGAGTVYWKKNTEALGELVIDNGGRNSSGWSTPVAVSGILRLNSFTVAAGAHVSTSAGVRVMTGNPTSFASLISSNYLQIGSLLVSNTWVFGDVIEPVMSRSNGVPVVTVYCQPQKTYLLLATTNFLDWSAVGTFTPTGSSFVFADTDAPRFGRRLFRAVMLDYLFDGIGVSLNPTNRQARLTLDGAQPNHTLVLQASDDLRQWTPITTFIPTAVTNWQFLDTNAPSFQRRFYRAVGQGR